MSVADLGARVQYAKDLHPNEAMSELIQRTLDEGVRATQIAQYLASTKERFFNSLVLATYGGNPEWLELGGFKSETRADLLSQISESSLNALGFLSLTGTEKIFAIDGQHRLAGIKQALNHGNDLENEQLPVVFVAHKNTKLGMQRTRRLFTTLNKTAEPVSKQDIIALDEDDAMAITVRRLVEDNPAFQDPKIAVISSPGVPAGNQVCLTTISNLYDILHLLFKFDAGIGSDRSLRFSRPSDEQLEYYYNLATSYFAALGSSFAVVASFFRAANPGRITRLQRGSHGGHLLFRPIGLEIFTRAVLDVAVANELAPAAAIGHLATLPTNLAEAPYLGVIWDATRERVIPSGKRVALDVVRYLAGLRVDRAKLVRDYSRALGRSSSDAPARLPAKL